MDSEIWIDCWLHNCIQNKFVGLFALRGKFWLFFVCDVLVVWLGVIDMIK